MYAVLFPRARMELQFYLWRFHVGTVPANALTAVAAWLGEQGLLGLLALITGWRFGIAFLAHVGGLRAGAALGLTLTRFGLAPACGEMLARTAAPFMTCPGCRAAMPWREAGRYRCSSCGTRFRVDEEGNVGVRSPSEPKVRP
jgi:hypothetical protein